jgi:hypothetical protein
MPDIPALIASQPVFSLSTEVLATLSGFHPHAPAVAPPHHDRIELLAPPASHREPFIDPLAALTVLGAQQGMGHAQARAWVNELIGTQASLDWVCFFDLFEPDSPPCLPARQFVLWLREGKLVRDATADFLDQAIETVMSTPVLSWPTVHDRVLTLAEFPLTPPPLALATWLPAGPWVDIDAWGSPAGRVDAANPYVQWRSAIAPVAARLTQHLGESVFHFADLHEELDDDIAHRLLVLHWCCTHQPRSSFVRHLLRVSGAPDVEVLKAALTDPAHYVLPCELDMGPACFVRQVQMTCPGNP